MRLFLIILALFFSSAALSSYRYSPKSLKMKDYEEMREILQGFIKSSQAEAKNGKEEAAQELKIGLKVLFMRPDIDSINNSLIPIIQQEVIKYQPFASLLRGVAEEALSAFPAHKNSPEKQAAQLYIIENSIAYLQSGDNTENNTVLKKIASADLSISDSLSSWLILEMGRGKTASPSDLARKILKERKKMRAAAEAASKTSIKNQSSDSANKRLPSSDTEQERGKSPPKVLKIDL